MNEKRRRVLMTITGVIISGISVGLFNCAGFGADPFQVFAQGVAGHVPVSYGTFYVLLNLSMLAAVFAADRTKIGLGTVINIFLLGYVVEASTYMFRTFAAAPGMLLRILFLITGLIMLCLASSLYFVGDMGVSTYDAVALYMTEHQVAKFFYCRIATDLFCVISGWLFGATVGAGTVITAFFMGPVITFFANTIAKPLRYGPS